MTYSPRMRDLEVIDSEHYPGGITRRSWLYRTRYGMAGNPNLQGPKRKGRNTCVADEAN